MGEGNNDTTSSFLQTLTVPTRKLTPPFTEVFIELNVCIKLKSCSKYCGCRSSNVGKLSRGGGGRTDGMSKESRFFCCLEAPTDINTICKINTKTSTVLISYHIFTLITVGNEAERAG